MRREPTTAAPYAIAHRAGNHEALLHAAFEAGADLIEADVRFHRGRIEVRHLKTMGPVPLLWDKWLLRPGWTPRFQLDDLLAITPPGCELMLDLKASSDPSHPERVVAAMRAQMPGREYTVCSQYWAMLQPFHEEPGVRVVHSIGSARMLRAALPHLEHHRSDGVSIHKKLLTATSVAELRKRVGLVMTWAVRTETEVHHLRSLGVNAFIVDSPALLRTIIAMQTAGDENRL